MEQTAIVTQSCPACGAPARSGQARCAWCGSAFWPETPKPAATAPRVAPTCSDTPSPVENPARRRLATGALLLPGIAVIAWWPGLLPQPANLAIGQAHLVVLLVATVGWLGAESARQVRPWSILLASSVAATAVVIASNQATGTALSTGEARFFHLAVLVAGAWLAAGSFRRRRLPARRDGRRTLRQPAW